MTDSAKANASKSVDVPAVVSENPPTEPDSLAESLKRLRETNPLFALLFTTAAFLGAIVLVWNAGQWLWTKADSELRPYEQSYQALDQVAAGMPLSQFTEKLGLPILQSQPNSLGQIEYIYEGKGFYAQAITDEHGSVIFNSVTACSDGFEYNGASTQTPLKRDDEPANGHPRFWFLSGATSNSYGFLEIPSSNPSGYRTSYVGFNDACSWSSPLGSCSPTVSSIGSNWAFRDKDQQAVDSWLACVSSNTVGWTSPADISIPFYDDCDPDDQFTRQLTRRPADAAPLERSDCFTIGPNRIAVRTLPRPNR